ncbi:hypothetical protein [Bradyrhizobium manausense]|uniref:hypothetical protein n=1 Tax=Bradyrhizobium manausense TaxID=989370 RepID=UPI0028A232E8|nr:hypothetical protein [Bradyrhizobium manausense]
MTLSAVVFACKPRESAGGPLVKQLMVVAGELPEDVTREIRMEQILINLVAGALGGIGAGKSSPTFDLGMAGNIISGLVGGGVLGQIATLLLPSVLAAAQSGNLSVGGIVSQVVAGGAGGAILTAIIGAIKNKAAA